MTWHDRSPRMERLSPKLSRGNFCPENFATCLFDDVVPPKPAVGRLSTATVFVLSTTVFVEPATAFTFISRACFGPGKVVALSVTPCFRPAKVTILLFLKFWKYSLLGLSRIPDNTGLLIQRLCLAEFGHNQFRGSFSALICLPRHRPALWQPP